MAPGTKAARLIFHSGFSCYLGDFTLRNVIANLAQNVKPRACWLDCFVFHPCRVAGSKGQANTFSLFLWDGCEFSARVITGTLPSLEAGCRCTGDRTHDSTNQCAGQDTESNEPEHSKED